MKIHISYLIMVITILGLIISFLLLNEPAYQGIYDPVTAWDKGSDIDIFFAVWGGRLFAFGLLGLVFYIIKSFYNYVITQSNNDAEIEIEREKTEQSKLAFEPTQKATIIPFNTQNKVIHSGRVVLTNDLELTKNQLSDFAVRSIKSDIGLAISKWKKEGWDQEVIERFLDYLNSIGLVTERANGRACVYTGEYRPEHVLRVVTQNAVSIE